MVELKDFIKFVSENYMANVFDGNVELLPFENMKHKIIKKDDYDNVMKGIE